MPPSEAAIVGVGMLTAVGLSVDETVASARAGTMRFTESDLLDSQARPFTLAQVPDDGLPNLVDTLAAESGLSSRERRMLRLAARPLIESLEGRVPSGHRPGLCLALPETKTQLPIDPPRFLHRLAMQVGGVFDPGRSDASHVGRAGAIVALAQAVAAIASGQAELMLVGGIDTYRDPYVLGMLDAEQRVKSAANLDGFVPGEAATFLLVAHPQVAAARRLRPLATISPVAIGYELGHLYAQEPYRGEALASVFAQLAQAGVTTPVTDVYSSMNGESHWAKEWGIAVIRNRRLFASDPRIHHPADCFGDIGAAIGPTLLGLAAMALGSHRRPGPALVYCSSDRGQRAAVVVSPS